MTKAVAIMSGGIDSTVALAMAQDAGWEITGLFFRYGQRNLSAEEIAVKKVAKHYNVPLRQTIIPSLMAGALISGHRGVEVPKDRTIEEIVPVEYMGVPEGLPATFVPGRNLIMLALAGALAYEQGATQLVGGWHWEDSSGYPDCRLSFLTATKHAITLALDRQMAIYHPLITLSKGEIIQKGYEFQVPFKLTHSCYDPVSLTDWTKTQLRNALASANPGRVKWAHCGRCDACILRIYSFKAAGVSDPTVYDQEVK